VIIIYTFLMNNITFLFLAILLFTSCAEKRWEKSENGVIIHLKDRTGVGARLVSLEPVNDRIIHVVASPLKTLSNGNSLCIYGQQEAASYDVSERGDSLIITTLEIKASVSLITGAVTFMDKNDELILKESDKGGKSFVPFSVEGTDGYSIRQVFESPVDEAFYGLGQHQSDEFNYKGLNESLYQYNTKVSVPFVVSNRNYGILWDNYSLTKFGDPRDYSQLDLFKLFDDEGKEGALTVTYSDFRTSRIFHREREAIIDFENIQTGKKFPAGIQPVSAEVVWSGELEPEVAGLYHFKIYYAGYVRLYIDNELIVPERWRTAWNPNTYKFSKELKKDRRYPIRLVWRPDGEVSYISLKALSPRPEEEQGSLSLFSEMGDRIEYYFIKGNNIDEVISGYRTLTGKAPVMPLWSLGYWQSRERYRSQDELLDVVREYRRRNIPLDNIVLDWSYWPVDSWGSHEFDPKYFPDPEGMVDEVHRMNARIMISVWPKFYHNTEHFREFDRNGWMYRQAVNDSIRDWIGKGHIGSFYDPYSQGARDLFWNQIREHLYSLGFDAWWLDASEPDILSNAGINYRKLLSTPTAIGPSTKYFNTYALMNASAIYHGQRSVDPDKRVFILTRSGFAGLQGYSTATWSGDIGTRWEEMKAQISAGLNYSLSGIPYWTMDIGGFCVENRYVRAVEGTEDMNEWRELNTRWYQFGSFCPLFRSHGQFPFREIYNIAPPDHPAYRSMVYYDKLRYYLMPYIYSLAGVTYFNDYTIMRAMVMDFGGDKNVKNIGDQYMFGPSLLVAPVYKYKAVKRVMYFPAGTEWYDFYTGKYVAGDRYLEVDAPYERIPLFVKEGSIIPVGPEIQYTDEKPADPVSLWIYTGRDCVFSLYEDEGINYNYESGAYSAIRISYDDKTGELTIGERMGEFSGMLHSRTFNIIWIERNKPGPFDPEIHPHKTVRYEGKEIRINRK